jgi:hypothetical protein
LGEVRGSRFDVRGEAADFIVEGKEDGGGERLAAEALRAVLDASRERLLAECKWVGQFAAKGCGDGVEFGRMAWLTLMPMPMTA